MNKGLEWMKEFCTLEDAKSFHKQQLRWHILLRNHKYINYKTITNTVT